MPDQVAMSGFYDSPRTASVAPPGYKSQSRATTPFHRNRAALDRAPQDWGTPAAPNGAWSSPSEPLTTSSTTWGPTVGQSGGAWAPTGATYEPVTHGNPAESHFLPSTPRQRTTRTFKRS